MALGSIGRLLKARLEKGAQIVLLAQQKSSTDRLNWIKAAKHLAAQGVEVKIVWPGSCDDINHLLTTNGPNAVMAAIEAAERVTLDDDQDLVEMNAKYAVVSISGRTRVFWLEDDEVFHGCKVPCARRLVTSGLSTRSAARSLYKLMVNR